MKNIINYPINFANIPIKEKMYLYIHDDLLKDFPSKNLNEELEIINNCEIKTAPFWNDEIIYTQDEEIDYLLNLEAEEMKKYLEKKDNFWILVRKSVKEKLIQANNYFKWLWYELLLKIWYRPLEVQKKLFEKIYKYFTKKYSFLTEKEIYDKTIEFIADPTKYIAPHTTGWAIDLILIDLKWNEVDMWCKVNYIWEKANMTTTSITEKQKKNRELLALWMANFWFANLASEWWHFSYGDPYWAYFYWEKKSLYNAIDF
jgi:D-alanyl-D-alanine dipeptidase